MVSIQSTLTRSFLCVFVLAAEIPFNFSHYRYRFSIPQLEWPMALNRMWYSFDIARAHFIGLVFTHSGLPLAVVLLAFEGWGGEGDLVQAQNF